MSLLETNHKAPQSGLNNLSLGVGQTFCDKTLNNKTFKINDNNKLSVINKKYENVTNKVNGLYYEIMANMDALRGNLINHDIMIRALRASQKAIKEAQKDGEFANHRGFMRNTPVLNQVCVCLDLILNFLGFLEEKIQKKLNHDQRPVYKSMEEFKLGMFKPAKTSTARNIDDLSTDIDWYIEQIENEYRCALPMGSLRYGIHITTLKNKPY